MVSPTFSFMNTYKYSSLHASQIKHPLHFFYIQNLKHSKNSAPIIGFLLFINMGNNGHHHFTSVCEKIIGVVFPTSHRNRHSHHQKQSFPEPTPMSLPNHHHNYGSNSISTTPPTHVSYHQDKHRPNSDHIMNPPNKLVVEKSHAQGSAESASHIQPKQHTNKPRSEPPAKDIESGVDINDAFSEYINHAKIKIRAMSSNVGGEEIIASRVDNINETGKLEDDFSAYINRAKVMIRKTSTIGSTNFISFKRD